MILASVCAGDSDCGLLSSLELLSRSAGQEGSGHSSGSGSEGEEGAAYGRYGGGGAGESGSGSEGGGNGWNGVAGSDSEDAASAWGRQPGEMNGSWQGEHESAAGDASDGSGQAAYDGSSNGSNGSSGGSRGGRGKQAGAVQELALDLDSWQQVGVAGALLQQCNRCCVGVLVRGVG